MSKGRFLVIPFDGGNCSGIVSMSVCLPASRDSPSLFCHIDQTITRLRSHSRQRGGLRRPT